jgi:hypothetical protein
LSTRRVVNASLDAFAEDAHQAILVALIVSVATAVALIIALAFLTPRGALLGCGVALLVGAGLALLTCAGWYGLSNANTDDYLADQFLELANGLVWAPLRASAVLFGLGIVATVTGVVVSRRWPLLPSATATA